MSSATNWEGHSFAGSEIMTVLVDKDEVKYYLHKDKLTSECPFFAKCLGSGMKEAHTNEVKLPEDDVEALDCFVDWIYKEPMPNISVGESVIVTMKAWVLAEKLCMPKWQNALIDHLAHIFTYFPVVKASHLSWINDNVPTPSPLSNFMRDYFAHELAKNAGAYRKKQESELGLDEGLWSALSKSPTGDQVTLKAIAIARDSDASNPKNRPHEHHVPV
ncbi:hypothetical protein PV08_10238 [Exophiala spinifera]|uniref:BTB domain-containing protein n=1 Tax=Exophiala spinifera TaxID=91928 RepID=A0A0D2BHU0_9EURO|nr:uncharacterized protein PV08_10238 [Exophiala spinifera]KIW10939.1 hypothetical protein PV08_10238 [Exophiala spinifera]